MGSADPVVSLAHVPDIDMDAAKFDQVVSNAKELWRAMLDPDDLSIKMPHDGYLKVYQLSKPIISSYKNKFEVILFDEYQDANPLTLDLVMSQPTSIVYVGDMHQSIYAFRGTVDALSYIDADETHYLTNSYRFGQPVADIANALLGHFCKGHRPLVGAGSKQDTAWSIDEAQSYAVISRTNSALFDVAASRLSHDVPFSFIGGVEGYKFSVIEDAYSLCIGETEKVRDP